MKTERLLITGASGMLGACLVEMFNSKYFVYATGNSQFEGNKADEFLVFDLRKSDYRELIEWAKPNVIINCAAITNGNLCEENINDAFEINGFTVHKLMKHTQNDVKIIQISTDAVFNSFSHLAKEQNNVGPENVYGKSKELGEFFLLNSNREFSIIRTTIVGLNSNKNKEGFTEWIIRSVKNGTKINLFSDVYFTPITIWDLANSIDRLISSNSYEKVLHIAGSQVCTKYEFGVSLINKLGYDTTNINEGSIQDFAFRAKRSSDQTLDSTFFEKKFNCSLPNLNDTIETICSKIKYYE
ncbi:MAG: SDR family oxidoreductase [Cyclobacteriaceae bacterium]|nr:SDR family oxidoreductase [Cyclobacteriaceae bacterium]